MFLSKHFLGARVDDLEDIQRNLGFVLSSKRACGYFLTSFGLSEMTFRTPEEAVVRLSAEIEENIRLYEPRVALVKISEVYDDDGRVKLIIRLRLRSKDETLRLVVDAKSGTFTFEIEAPGRR
jgi:predicted component of type VI protein secretion system